MPKDEPPSARNLNNNNSNNNDDNSGDNSEVFVAVINIALGTWQV